MCTNDGGKCSPLLIVLHGSFTIVGCLGYADGSMQSNSHGVARGKH